MIIFPACFSFGIEANSGPPLIFLTLPRVFVSMAGGRVWGALFFLFLTFASFTTIIAVFENIMACCMDSFGWSRKKPPSWAASSCSWPACPVCWATTCGTSN